MSLYDDITLVQTTRKPFPKPTEKTMNKMTLAAFGLAIVAIGVGSFVLTKSASGGAALIGAGTGLLGLLKERPDFAKAPAEEKPVVPPGPPVI